MCQKLLLNKSKISYFNVKMDLKKQTKTNTTYDLRKVLKSFFQRSVLHNARRDSDAIGANNSYCREIEENEANELLDNEQRCQMNSTSEDEIEEEQLVPVHYTRTRSGTFFWTSSAYSEDADLIQPLQCYTMNQIPVEQLRHR